MHLLYDDQCQFCCAIARWAKAQNAEIEVWSVRSTESKELLKTHGIHFIDLQTVYFVEGAVYVRSRAAFQMIRHTQRPWRWLAPRVLPGAANVFGGFGPGMMTTGRTFLSFPLL